MLSPPGHLMQAVVTAIAFKSSSKLGSNGLLTLYWNIINSNHFNNTDFFCL